MLQKEIEKKLATYLDPYLGVDLFTANAVKKIAQGEGNISIDITLGYPVNRLKNIMIQSIEQLLKPLMNGQSICINIQTKIEPHTGKQKIPQLPNIKNIIAVASGKGGVGKSTIAVNLAMALAEDGANVGILDADIYGPSQPKMLNSELEKPQQKNKTFIPIQRHGVQSMSIGYLVAQNVPMVWRGPMIGKAMQQLLLDTQWDNLDYLIVDLPPGTGDVQLTLCQKIPVSGAVIVTTPQDLALLDVTRACEMFRQLNVPILGVVENMSVYHCPKCGHEEKIFGEGGGKKLAEQYEQEIVATIPLNRLIREMTDSGHPLVIADPNGPYTELFIHMARKIAAKLSLQTKDYSSRFPKIVVEHGNEKESYS